MDLDELLRLPAENELYEGVEGGYAVFPPRDVPPYWEGSRLQFIIRGHDEMGVLEEVRSAVMQRLHASSLSMA